MTRSCTTLAALCAILLAPLLGDALACAAARACAAAPCCVTSRGACPMHNDGSQRGCRVRSCGAHDEVSAVQVPLAAHRPLASLSRIDMRPAIVSGSEILSITIAAPPPDPPPPRLG